MLAQRQNIISFGFNQSYIPIFFACFENVKVTQSTTNYKFMQKSKSLNILMSYNKQQPERHKAFSNSFWSL